MSKILIIVDAQKDFITGSLAVKTAKEKMRKLAKYILNYGEEYSLIVATLDWHPSTHCSFEKNGGEWPEHCVQDTEGAEFWPPLKAVIEEKGIELLFLTKGDNEDVEEYSIFKNAKSAEKLLKICKKASTNQIDVCGIALDYCVANTLKDAVKNGLSKKLSLLKDFSPCIGDDKSIVEFLEDEDVDIIENIDVNGEE